MDEIKNLSEAMRRALMFTEPGDLMKGGPTRAALIRRGHVFRMSRGNGVAGKLTPQGEKVREILLKEEQ